MGGGAKKENSQRQDSKLGALGFDVSVVPRKAKQSLLPLRRSRLFMTELTYLHGICFRGILSKET